MGGEDRGGVEGGDERRGDGRGLSRIAKMKIWQPYRRTRLKMSINIIFIASVEGIQPFL
jgi:hypothetical protein